MGKTIKMVNTVNVAKVVKNCQNIPNCQNGQHGNNGNSEWDITVKQLKDLVLGLSTFRCKAELNINTA